MTVELDRGAALIEQLLGDPALRRRFRADPAVVLEEHGLPDLASGLGRGERALLTLELRESRSSLAGVMVAAAAEGVDFAHIAERAAPRLEHGAGQVVDRLVNGNGSHHPHKAPAPAHPAAKPVPPSIGSQASLPPMASSAPAHAAADAPHGAGSGDGSAQAPAGGAAGRQPAGAGAGQQDAGAGAGQRAAGTGTSQQDAGAGADQQDAGAEAGQRAAGTGTGGASVRPPADSHGSAASGQPAGTGHRPQAAGQQPAASGQQPAAPGQQPAASGQQPAAPGQQNHSSAPDPGDAPAPTGDVMNYPGNEASQQQIAAWMGAQAKAAGLPPELPVMAALTESTLRNIPYGDHDSVGFFQMRLSIWNSGPYAGYLDNPQLQIKWFIDHALAARAEDPALAQSPSTWGQWIANVEQPAAEYRYRYQLQLGAAQELLRGTDLPQGPAPGGATSPAPGDGGAPSAPAGTDAPSASAGTDAPPAPAGADAPSAGGAAPASAAPAVQIPVGQAALNAAMRFAHGGGGSGASPGSGIEGPGLVQRAYEQEGINLPPAAAEQFDVGMPVSLHDLRPGDAVFFSDAHGSINHAALYAGNGQIVSAPDSGDHVKVYSLSDSPFAGHFIGARRYTAGALADPKHYARTLPTIKS